MNADKSWLMLINIPEPCFFMPGKVNNKKSFRDYDIIVLKNI